MDSPSVTHEFIGSAIAYSIYHKIQKVGFVCNWFGCQNDAPNSPKYSDVIAAKEDAWFGSKEAAIANTKNDLIAFLREFAKQ